MISSFLLKEYSRNGNEKLIIRKSLGAFNVFMNCFKDQSIVLDSFVQLASK